MNWETVVDRQISKKEFKLGKYPIFVDDLDGVEFLVEEKTMSLDDSYKNYEYLRRNFGISNYRADAYRFSSGKFNWGDTLAIAGSLKEGEYKTIVPKYIGKKMDVMDKVMRNRFNFRPGRSILAGLVLVGSVCYLLVEYHDNPKKFKISEI